MANPFVDTDVIIRFLTGDDPGKQAEAAGLFERVEAGEVTLSAPDTVIADAVHVLSSPRLYRLPRPRVQELLSPLVRLPGLQVQNRRPLLRALEFLATTNLDFGDAMIVATMEQAGARTVCSYDAHFNGIPGITRMEPSAIG